MNIYVLDFDGVICDSARETGASAWKAGCRIWHEWDSDLPPDALLRRFVRLRPVIETGHESVLLMRLIWLDRSDHDILRRFPDLCSELAANDGLDKKELIAVFGETRDEWIRKNQKEWMGMNRFYPGVVGRIRSAMAESEIFILTTKQERFARMLLAAENLGFDEHHLVGLDRGIPKEETLEHLLQHQDDSGLSIHFVEDRIKTLIRVMNRESLNKINLYLARWGYVTEDDIARAGQNDRICIWTLDDFLAGD